MSPRYLMVYNKKDYLPERSEWLEKAWGDMPFSYTQDHEHLCSATYLDVKLNKWEINIGWSSFQVNEPWIRIEFFRGEALKLFLEENFARFGLDCNDDLLVVFELDEGWLNVDMYLLDRIVCAVSDKGVCYFLSEAGLELLDEKHFEKVPSVSELKVVLSKDPLE